MCEYSTRDQKKTKLKKVKKELKKNKTQESKESFCFLEETEIVSMWEKSLVSQIADTASSASE